MVVIVDGGVGWGFEWHKYGLGWVNVAIAFIPAAAQEILQKNDHPQWVAPWPEPLPSHSGQMQTQRDFTTKSCSYLPVATRG